MACPVTWQLFPSLILYFHTFKMRRWDWVTQGPFQSSHLRNSERPEDKEGAGPDLGEADRPAGPQVDGEPVSFTWPVCGSSGAGVRAPLCVHHAEHHLSSQPLGRDQSSPVQVDSGQGCESGFLGRGGVLGRKCSTWVVDPTPLLICQSF